MRIKKNSNRFKRLQERYFSSKAGVIFVLNRKLGIIVGEGRDFGKVTDLELDREDKNILLEVTHRGEANTIAIIGYGFNQRKGAPWLVWKDIDFDGPESSNYRKRFNKINGIELSPKYVNFVEAIL